MKQWSIGLMSNNEKKNILDQHRTLYSGYKTMQPEVSNTQPLYIQDFANDKGGVTVSNKGEVKRYTNVGINEQVEKESMCSECGGMVYEGECMECGYGGKEMGEETQQVKDLDNVEDLNLSDKFDYTEEEMYEDDAVDADALQSVTGQEAPHDEDDMAPDGMDDDSDDYRHMMAYTEEDEVEEQVGGGTAPYQNFSELKPAYNFISGGPLEEEGDESMDDGEELYPTYSDDKFMGMSKGSGDMDDNWEEIDVFSEVDDDLKESVTKQKNRIMEMMSRMKSYN